VSSATSQLSDSQKSKNALDEITLGIRGINLLENIINDLSSKIRVQIQVIHQDLENFIIE